MKNRYKVENNIITDSDASYSASEFYLTDETLQVKNADGSCRYKIVAGDHVLRSQAEIENDSTFLNAYKKEVWKELYGTLKDNLFEIIVNKRQAGNPTFNFDDVVAKAQLFKNNAASYSTVAEIDTARDQAINWMGIE